MQKLCRGCKQIKLLTEFNKDTWHKDGLQSRCRNCRRKKHAEYYNNNKDAFYLKIKEYRRKNPDKVKKWQKTYQLLHLEQYLLSKQKANYKTKYGISLEQKIEMIKQQDGKCAICKIGFLNTKGTHVDHNHITGKVRDIICVNCNRNLGVLENIKFMQAATAYLTQHA